ncbi:hypothetical protein MMC18_001958 [Xylographa bjoerkii]|nr:hypothetical protein [Xylographa bjoerkii]
MAQKKNKDNSRPLRQESYINHAAASKDTVKTFQLDWSAISKGRQAFVDCVCILRALSFVHRDYGSAVSTILRDEIEESQYKHSDDEESDTEDTDFEPWESATSSQPLQSSREEADEQGQVMMRLKDRFLDRLAEVLARSKGLPTGPDHVCATYMEEIRDDAGEQSVQIRYAKNAGVAQEDEAFLTKIHYHIQDAIQHPTQSDDVTKELLKDILEFSNARVNHYAEQISKNFKDRKHNQLALSPMAEYVQSTRSFKVPRIWGDQAQNPYIFTTMPTAPLIDDLNSVTTLAPDTDRSPDQAYEGVSTTVEVIFEHIEKFCTSSTPYDFQILLVLIQSTVPTFADVRTQAVFKSRFQSYCEDRGLGAAKAARVLKYLMYLCRFSAAASTIVKFALTQPSCERIAFVPVNFSEKVEGSTVSPSISQALRRLPFHNANGIPQTVHGSSFSAKKESLLKELQARPSHVHAEVQLVVDYETKPRISMARHIHPYIGSSKLCCYLCYIFLKIHNVFGTRGSHWKLYTQWAVPTRLPSNGVVSALETVLARVSTVFLTRISGILHDWEYVEDKHEVPESVIDFNTIATLPTSDVSAWTLRQQRFGWRGAYGPSASDGAVYVVPLWERPGFATVIHHFADVCSETSKTATLNEAEIYKDCYERKVYLPSADRLVYIFHQPPLSAIFASTFDPELHAEPILKDVELAKVFGFGSCATAGELKSLCDLFGYLCLQKRLSASRIQSWVDSGMPIEKTKYAKADKNLLWLGKPSSDDQPESRSWDEYRTTGIARALEMFHIEDIDELWWSQSRVFQFYTRIWRPFLNIPTWLDLDWLDFGFCFSSSQLTSSAMVIVYTNLATVFSLKEIAEEWEAKNHLNDLVNKLGQGDKSLIGTGIRFGRPPHAKLRVYRLIIEVQRLVSGIPSGRKHKSCLTDNEPWFSVETTLDYGYHALVPWERWQLTLLYQELFATPGFNIQDMHAACIKRSVDKDALQHYVEALIDTRSTV